MSAAKICGLCRPEDAAAAAAAGAAYAGVVLLPGRARSQSLASAARIFAAAGELRRVGVFSEPSRDEVLRAVAALELDVVQLHGDEAPELASALSAAGVGAVWKAVRVAGPGSLAVAVRRYEGAVHGVLLDGGSGGAGVAFAWDAVAGERALVPAEWTLVVAGGLDAANVAAAVAALAPDVVDVSSGVETAVGVKSAAAIRAFVAAAAAAEKVGGS